MSPTIKELRSAIADCDKAIIDLQAKKREYRDAIKDQKEKKLEEGRMLKRAQSQVEITDEGLNKLKAKLFS